MNHFGKPRAFYCGRSMSGVFRDGDTIECSPPPETGVRRGDVVVFESGGRLVIHRVVECAPDGIRTMGDNNPGRDPRRLAAADIIGVARFFERGGRRRRVRNGLPGMLCFYRRRIWRNVLYRPLRFLFSRFAADRRGFWRIRRFEVVKFGRDRHYRWHGVLIAVEANGRLRYRHSFYRIFFAPER